MFIGGFYLKIVQLEILVQLVRVFLCSLEGFFGDFTTRNISAIVLGFSYDHWGVFFEDFTTRIISAIVLVSSMKPNHKVAKVLLLL
jgi:hypothetical protein